VNLRVGAGEFSLGAELGGKRVPELRVGFGGGDVEVEGEVLTDFGAIGGDMEFAVLADGIIDEEAAIEGLLADGLARLFGLGGEIGELVDTGGGIEGGGVEHGRGIIDVLDEGIGG